MFCDIHLGAKTWLHVFLMALQTFKDLSAGAMISFSLNRAKLILPNDLRVQDRRAVLHADRGGPFKDLIYCKSVKLYDVPFVSYKTLSIHKQ